LDFYLGFGWILSTYLLLQSVVLWQIAQLAHRDFKMTQRATATFVLANIAAAGLSAWFVFAAPAISFTLIAVCLVAALVPRGERQRRPSSL